MSLIEKIITDKIEIIENNFIQIRKANIILKDGVEINRSFTRYVLKPGDDVSNEEQKIKDIANILWTEEIINNYKISLELSLKKLNG
jgi:hypothetical protein